MKILIINRYFCEFSAGESLSLNLFLKLKELGNDVYFFATDKKPYYIADYEYSKYFPNDNFTTIGYLKNPIGYYWDFDANKKLSQMIEDIKPDIIHCNQPITFSIFNVIKKFNIPVVWTLHDSAIFCGSSLQMGNGKYCSKFLCKNGNYWHCLFNRCKGNKIEPSIRKMVLGYINYKFHPYDKVDVFVTPSFALKNKVIEANLGICEDKIKVVNNYLPLPRIESSQDNLRKYFLYVGRLVEEKGAQYILEAAKNLPKEIPFIIAGTGPYENELKQIAKDYNLSNVEFVGYVKYESINELYKNAIATLVPSICFEVFGMINIESFANKVPVIGSDIGGIPEIIRDNIDGFIFQAANVDQLKNYILRYWNNKKLAVEHGDNAYNRFKELYVEDVYYKRILDIYEMLLAERRDKNEVIS